MSWSYCTPVNSTAVNADKNPIGDGGPSRIFTAAVKAHFVGPSWSEPLENLRDIGFWRARHLDRNSQSLKIFPLICDLLLHWNCHLYMYLQSCSQHCLYRRRSTVIHVTTRVEDLVWIIHIYFLSSRHYSYIHSSIDSAVIPILIWFDAQEKIMNIIGV